MNFRNIFRTFEKVFFPGGFALIIGIVLMAFSASSGQTTYFTLGGAAIAFFGVVSILFSLGVINRVVQYLLFAIFLAGSLGVGYLDYKTIKDDLDYKREKKVYNEKVIQALKDIRTAEQAYKTRFGKFTGEWDTLTNFLKHDSISYVRQEGSRPDTLTEEKALELGIVKKDTFYTSVVDSLFYSKRARMDRPFKFKVDSISYVPSTKEQFILKAGVIEKSGGIQSPVFMAKDPSPFAPPDTLQVGSMTQASTSGNWGD